MTYDQTEVEHFRQQKALFFRRNKNAPLRGDAVEGMNYFPISTEFVFEAKLEPLQTAQRVWFAMSRGEAEAYIPEALAHFDYAGNTYTLVLYRPDGSDDSSRLFMPFTDSSNGQETYPAGRYLEVVPERETARLDFNFAYNPYCAYSEQFRCPIPPKENRLDFAVQAGEKSYQAP
ncbi:MAG: DUF1684 domain-containing protein [Trueperaceae bacterium]|nr:DUF1684 domain-containing protein [Trueperaceae bacterium]